MRSFIIVYLFLVFLACKEKVREGAVSDIEIYQGLETKIISEAGASFEKSNYLAFPFNHGIIQKDSLQDLDVLILGKPLHNSVFITPLATISISDEGKDRIFILAWPQNEDDQNLKPCTFEEFMTKYSAIKLMLETYFLNYKGLGKVKIVRWGSNAEAVELIKAYQ